MHHAYQPNAGSSLAPGASTELSSAAAPASQLDSGVTRPGSSGNAIQHGLTAARHLPAVLDPQRLETLRRAYHAEFQPAGISERLLVDELARHAAMLEVAQQVEWAVLRQAARNLPEWARAASADDDEDSRTDATLAATMAPEAVDRITRYRRAHERAYHGALRQLEQLQAKRRQVPDGHAPLDWEPPRTEQECEQRLRRRFAARHWRCPGCGCAEGCYLTRRRVWECSGCRRQFGLRVGTLMEGSPLPLRVWLSAIHCLVNDPHVSVAALADRLGIRRQKTVRRLHRVIREALSRDAAGVMRLVRPELPELSAPG